MKTATQANKASRQAGFGHIITVAVIVMVFSSIGYIGFKLYAHPLTSTDDSGLTTIQKSKTEVPTAPNVTSAGDLDKATAALDSVDPSTTSKTDESSLDSQLDGIQ